MKNRREFVIEEHYEVGGRDYSVKYTRIMKESCYDPSYKTNHNRAKANTINRKKAYRAKQARFAR